jgi:uncharacterized protein (UPF0332 family)
MTGENKRENANLELGRSAESLAAAELLFEHGHLREAVSRLYYALFYGFRALLFSEGIEPRTHEGVLRMFSLRFVQSGKFKPEDAHIFARLMKFRWEADYSSAYVFTPADFLKLSDESQELLRRIRVYLK